VNGEVAQGVEVLARLFQLCDTAQGILGGQEGAVQGFIVCSSGQASMYRGRPCFQADDEPGFRHPPAVPRAEDGTAPGGDDDVILRAGSGKSTRLAVSERFFAFIGEDLEYRFSRLVLNDIVSIDRPPSKALSNETSYDGLASSRETGEE
jgi:hypothetical protein